MLTFSCPGCGKKHRAPQEWQGKFARCDECGTRFRVPSHEGTCVLSTEGNTNGTPFLLPPQGTIEPGIASKASSARPITAQPPETSSTQSAPQLAESPHGAHPSVRGTAAEADDAGNQAAAEGNENCQPHHTETLQRARQRALDLDPDLERRPKEYAEEDQAEGGRVSFPDREALESELRSWLATLPPAAPASRPSGVCPPSALSFMVIWAVLACPLSALGGLLVIATAVAIAAALAFLFVDIAEGANYVVCCPLVFGLVTLGLGIVGTVAAIASIASGCVQYASHEKQNRNAGRAANLAAAAGSTGALLLGAMLYAYGTWIGGEDLAAIVSSPFFWLSVIIVTPIVGVLAYRGGLDAVHGERFCETCTIHMTEVEVPSVSLAGAKLIVRAASDHDYLACIGACKVAPGTVGVLTLFTCPTCGEGYFDVTIHFRASYWGGSSSKNYEQQWLALSAKLEPAAASKLRVSGELTSGSKT